MTYQDAVAYLDSLTNFEREHRPDEMRRVELSRMRRICRWLGDPQRRFRAVLIAGTNGKGSVAAMLYSMLRESELRAGLYTSPHIEHLRERIRAWTGGPSDGERAHADDWITPEAFADGVAAVRPALEAVSHETPEQPPTYFEAMTAVAFVHFQRQAVDVAVLEVGLGGRLDATNIVEPAVSVITPIAIDHADVLGRDPGAIAQEKSGIIKPGQIVISAPQCLEAASAIAAACDAQGALGLIAGRDLTARVARHDLDGLEATLTGQRGIYESVEIPLLGRHQAMNAVLAVGALEALSDGGVPHFVVERGLARLVWPGRLEIVHQSPLVIMDGAHNPHAADALAETVLELCPGRQVHLLIGMSSDKAVEKVGKALCPLAASVTCTSSRHPRALESAALANRLSAYCRNVHVMPDASDAYTYLLNAVPTEDVIVVTGSLFLVGQLRALLRKPNVGVRRAGIGV